MGKKQSIKNTFYRHRQFLSKSYMYNLNENCFCKQKKWEGHQNVFSQIHYKKIAFLVGIFATFRLVTFSRVLFLWT